VSDEEHLADDLDETIDGRPHAHRWRAARAHGPTRGEGEKIDDRLADVRQICSDHNADAQTERVEQRDGASDLLPLLSERRGARSMIVIDTDDRGSILRSSLEEMLRVVEGRSTKPSRSRHRVIAHDLRRRIDEAKTDVLAEQ